MKSFFLFCFSALLFCSAFFYTADVTAQCTGDIVLETQADVDAFAVDYGCSIIEGNLTIGLDVWTSDNINNLEGLTGISSIEGSLHISKNPYLTNLNGLQNLNSIGGDLQILNNDTLTNLNELQNINSIGGDLRILYNENLSNLDGLQNLASIGEDIKISLNPALTNLNGLQNLNSIQGSLSILENNALTNLDGLQNLASIGEDVKIDDNGNLSNLDGLQNLASIGKSIEIYHNENLSNLDGLQNLVSIGENMKIHNNFALTNLNGLININSIQGYLSIENNDALANLDGLQNLISESLAIKNNNALINLDELQNLNSIQGYLRIENNGALTNLDGLINIHSVGEYITISGNENLSNIDGLQNLSSIGEDITISSNPVLSNLSGLQNLNSIQGSLSILVNTALTNLDGLQNLISGNLAINGNTALTNLDELQNLNSVGYLWIEYNDALTNLDGLQNLNSIGSFSWIANNDALTNLDGLQNLNSIGLQLLIQNNDVLTNVDGLQNLNSIGGSVFILENDALTNLDGLQNLNSIENLQVLDNNSLAACCSILPLLANIEEDIYIENNLPNCNSVESIIFSCGGFQIQAFSFFDENENGILDTNEQAIQQSFSLSPSALFSFTDQSGIAYFYLDSYGEYELSINNINPLWEFGGTNNPLQISFQDSIFNDNPHYFPMSPVADFTIQSVDLSSSITRCNQETNYWLTYTNKGTTINDGYIQLIPSELVNFVSANPPADSTAGDALFWFYEDLYPTHSKQIHLVYQMPGVDQIGEQITFEANIETNEGFGDHKAILSSELICAYDPNDKLHTPSGYGYENYTLFEDTLEYTVRFQNTGNDTAFTVIIEDKLSQYLDLNTFRPIASSHNVETQIDIDSRLATFTFNDIYLPDSFVNEPGSHGFVKYRILGNESLPENTDVKNTASIFFDLNPPIITNTVNNRLVSELPVLAILTASADELIFEEIALDESVYVPQILIIENVGELTLHIEQFVFADSNFNSGETQIISVEGQSSVEVPIYFAPNEVGSYQSQLTLQSNGGELTIDLTGSAVLETGINSVETNSVKLFPNPNEGRFYIESKEHKILAYQIINSLGETVLEEKPKQHFSSIDLSKMGKGLYFISLQTEEGTFVEKIVVQ